MSVVNQMLRDIDARRTASPQPQPPLVGLQSIAPPPPPMAQRRSPWGFAGLLALTLAGAVSAYWWWPSPAPAPALAATSTPPPVAMTPIAATPTAATPPPGPSAIEQPTSAAPDSKPTRRRKAATVENPRDTPAQAASTTMTSADFSPKLSRELAQLPQREPAAAAAAPVRRIALEETLQNATNLWNKGAQDSALDLLRESLAIADSRGDKRATIAFSKELARLALAGSRLSDALDLLRRMEPVLAEDAEAWALRGNASQRLGLGAESANAYLTALRLKPNEARWMVGAAIALAGNGQMTEARDWARQARQLGGLNAEISAYLQQIGVLP